eukprot:230599-Rhodomonas_salina.1
MLYVKCVFLEPWCTPPYTASVPGRTIPTRGGCRAEEARAVHAIRVASYALHHTHSITLQLGSYAWQHAPTQSSILANA